MLKFLKKIIPTTAILLSFVYLHCWEKSAVIIGTGEIGYVESRKIRSEEFITCSALIIDYENIAVMVHALPLPLKKLERGVSVVASMFSSEELHPFQIHVNDAVKESVGIFERNGIDIQKTQAIIHAGEESGLETILSELKKYNIPIKSKTLVLYPINMGAPGRATYRAITYDPRTDSLEVEYKSNSLQDL